MGKALIIKGADFSANAITPDFIRLDYIVGSNTDGVGIFVPPSYMTIEDGMALQLKVKTNVLQTGTAAQTAVVSPVNSRNVNQTVRFWFTSTNTTGYYGNYASEHTGYNHGFGVSIIGDNTEHTFYISPTQMKMDSTTYDAGGTFHLESTGGTIGLDCYYANNSATDALAKCSNDYTEIFIAEVTVWDATGVLKVDAIPVKRTSDNVVCFYNTINGEYYTRNNGSTPSYILNGVRN